MAALGARLGDRPRAGSPLVLCRASRTRAGCVSCCWAGDLGVILQGSTRIRSKTVASGGKWTFVKGVALLGRWVPGSQAKGHH